MRVDGLDTESGKDRPRQLGTYPSQRAAGRALAELLERGDAEAAVRADKGTVGEYLDAWAAATVDVSPTSRLQYEWAAKRIRKGLGGVPLDQLTREDVANWIDGMAAGGVYADERLSAKTRFDYRANANAFVRPWLGKKRVRDLTPETILAWQRKLTAGGGTKDAKPLSANTVRLARSPLSGALKLAVSQGVVRTNPAASVSRPSTGRKIPRHWIPDQARAFLRSQEGDRLYPLWAFLLGSGLRIGELVWPRWDNVDLRRQHACLVEFASTLGWNLVESEGKSATAVRTIDLDRGLVAVLEQQREMQRFEARRASYEVTDYVFTKPPGGYYDPQSISKTLGRLSERAGLPRLTAHGLRHTSATLMLDSGIALKVAAERLGHADPTLFTNLYSHVTPTMQRDAANKLGQALFGDA